MLFDTSIKKHEELEKWVNALDIKCNDHVKIKSTSEFGIGLFLESPAGSVDAKIELLRVPLLSSYNIYTLRRLVNEELTKEDLGYVKKCLNIVFRNCQCSESNILIGYFIAILMICEKRKDQQRRDGWLQTINTYLQVLLNTTVGNMYTDQQDILQDYLSEFPGNAIMRDSIEDVIGGTWSGVLEEINEELGEEFDELKMAEVLQLCGAIRSRVLEIPRAVEESDADATGEEDGDNYYVDVTLVPILDYVNHDSEKRNAYFDIDRETGDVILWYESTKKEQPGGDAGEEQIFIVYDEHEDLHRMFANYGFIPRSQGSAKVLELPVLGYCGDGGEEDVELTRRLYSLRQSPNVQFKLEFGDEGRIVACDTIQDEYYSYLVFNNNVDWEEIHRAAEQEEVNNAEEEAFYVNGFRRCRDILGGMDEAEKRQVTGQFEDYVGKFTRQFKTRVENFVVFAEEYETLDGTSTNITSKLFSFYRELCERLLSQAAGESRGEDEPFLSLRMRPIYNFESIKYAENIQLEELKI